MGKELSLRSQAVFRQLVLFQFKFLVAVCSACSFQAFAASPGSTLKKIAIYSGPGSCRDCPQEIQKLIRTLGPGVQVDLLTAEQVRPEVLRGYHAFVQPGGENTLQVKAAIGDVGMSALKSYVQGGGRYVGICLGATLASRGKDEDGKPFLDLLPVTSVETETSGMKARIGKVKISFKGWGEREVFLQDPPYMSVIPGAAPAGLRVLASYPDGRVAAVIGEAGRGRALLLGPHFEAGADWFSHHGLRDRDGHDQAVFLDMMRELLGPDGGSAPARALGKSSGEPMILVPAPTGGAR